jgi:NAD(P)-dependent dehydrogenase (short-subunit alcohol dehydrogenase family)
MFGNVSLNANGPHTGINLDVEMAKGTISPREGWNRAYNTNVTSTQIFTNALMPLLFAASSSPIQTRILFVSSEVGSHTWHKTASEAPINKPLAAGWPKAPNFSITAYRSSKTAVGMMYREWCRVLANDHIKCHLVCPGLVATNLGGSTPEQLRQMGAKEPHVAAEFFRDVVQGNYDEYAGLNGKLVSQGHPVDW